MKKKNSSYCRLKRREFLGLAGTSVLSLTGILGCSRDEDEQDETQKTRDTQKPQTAQKGLIRPVKSPWFSELDDNTIRCELCPKECELASGERAPCRVRENRDGVGYTLAHGNPALIQEDPVERKPFFHVVPGSRALSVSTAGCNLECKFCEVWDMALVDPEDVHAYDMPPEAVVAHAREAGLRSVSYAFGEPVIFYEYMREVADIAQKEGLLNLLHTAGYIQPKPLKELIDRIDAVNVDLKSFDPVFYEETVGGKLEPVLRSLEIFRDAGIHIEITNIVIPTLNDDMEMIGKMCGWIADELGKDVPLHFARFYPLHKLSGLPRTPVSTLDKARNTAMEAGLNYVYTSRVTGHEGENTFCPDCGEIVINREGFVITEVNLDDGDCTHCGAEIPGRWV